MTKRDKPPLGSFAEHVMGLGVFAAIMSGRDPEELLEQLRGLASRTEQFREAIETAAQRFERRVQGKE